MQTPNQEPPVSFKAPNQNSNYMEGLCTLKISIENQIQNMGVMKTTEKNIQIKIKMPNPSQEPLASSRAPNQDLKDIDALCTFKIKIEN